MTFQNKNLNFAAAVQLCGGQEAIARDIIQMLVTELPEQSRELQDALDKKNWKNLDYVSHKLAGSAAYCGMDEIKKEARALNHLIRQQQMAELPQQMHQLQHAIKEALQAAEELGIKPQH
jgi:HPt (histidine-containing phosphotransfer) domain-containing protein